MNLEPFCVTIAGKTFRVNPLHTRLCTWFGDYVANQEADSELSLSQAEIDFERDIVEKSDVGAVTDGYYEKLAATRKITESLLSYSTFLMHGAVIAVDKQNSFMFTARSGTGKTTHIRKWLENVPEAFVVNGDKPLIKIAGEEAIAYGTPWCGKEHLNTNIGVPLRAIVLMERSEDNEIEEISFSQAFPTLLQQTYRPADADKMRKTLSLLSALNGKMKFYRFRFNNLKPDAFRVSYEALTGKRI